MDFKECGNLRFKKNGISWCWSCPEEHEMFVVSSSSDPDRIIHEHGVGVLEKTQEGRIVLDRARNKYKAELVQPGHPEFNKLYGKQVKEREEARRELQEHSRKLWEQKGGRETKILHENQT